ncbi:MAG: hypothetical protein H6799_01115 [Candidatus Nomurabacteria bacterium]|nr:MAG: hypothetical protein H6799_01115 [Candidatus Nomurabacteria bacterium]
MKKLFKKNYPTKSIHQEYEEIKVPSKLKNITVGKRLLIAGLIILAGAFTHTQFFNSSATPINDRDVNKIVSCSYSTFLGRIPRNETESRYWRERYVRTNYNIKDLARGLAYSSEGQRQSRKTGFGGFTNRAYEACLQRPITSTEYTNLLNQYRNGVSKEDLFLVIIKTGDRNVKFPTYTRCARYTQGGSVTPLCNVGSAGTSDNVVTTTVSGTNIVVNRGAITNFTEFVNYAKSFKYNLGAYTDPSLAAKKAKYCENGINLLKSPGSYRSSADQACLTYLGYPTARGVSMHRWGLAVDLTCNGSPLASSGNCLTWVRNNAGKFGIYNNSGEAWHFSTNGH